MPPMPRADTTKPMDWQIVTDMVPGAREPRPGRAQASTSRVWGRQPGHQGLLAGGTAYVTPAVRRALGAPRKPPLAFICFGEIISSLGTKSHLFHLALCLPSPSRQRCSRHGRTGPAGPSGELSQKHGGTSGHQTQRGLNQMKHKNYGEPDPFLARMMILSQVERFRLGIRKTSFMEWVVKRWSRLPREEQSHHLWWDLTDV